MAYDIFHNYGFDKKVKRKSLKEDFNIDDEIVTDYTFKASKSIPDSDGFMTDYTWYECADGTHVFVFGDNNIYSPEDGYFDQVCDSESEAREWFDSYEGFIDDEDDYFFDECANSKEEFFDKGFNKAYGIDVDDEQSLVARGDIVLTEDFDNLPSWFTNFLNNHREGSSVKRLLSTSGVDLKSASYIKGQLPKNSHDPQLRDKSRIAIFQLDDKGHNRVYVRGFNNPMVYSPITGEPKYVNQLPMRDILSITTEYGYIDLNDSRNTNTELRKERALLKKDAPPARGKGQYKQWRDIYDNSFPFKVIGKDFKWVTARGQDKSGYPLNPDKYVKMLDTVGLDDYGVRLDSYYKRIEALRNRIIPLMTKFDIDNSDRFATGVFSNNIYSDIGDALSKLGRAIDTYQRLKKECSRILNKESLSTEDKNDSIAQTFREIGGNLRYYLKQVTDSVKKLENTQEIPDSEE